MKKHVFRRAALQAAIMAVVPLGMSVVAALADQPVKDTSEWPCVYRKVPTLSAATIWDGPAITDTSSWRKDETIRKLSQYLISRRVSEDDADAAVKKFAAGLPADQHDAKLTELFAAVLTRTNEDRKVVMSGIERFHKRQMERAQEIEKEGIQLPPENEEGLTDESSGPAGEIAKLSPKEEKYKWEIRTFQEKQANIPIACEIPQLIDQRAGAIARAIRAEMKS
ncbi:MAG: hypothetical protein JSR99_14885 [Proteobacteria bacterium]|nr:hypothetical protein [Pseudomonadota bacterium]